MANINPGLQPAEIEKMKRQCRDKKQSYILNEAEPQGDEFAHFFFVGSYEGKECIFDAVMYTLRLHHSSLLYEMADDRAAEEFPRYKLRRQEAEDNDEEISEEEVDEEVELFKAELMDELEESEAVKVQEYVHADTDFDYGYALEVCLNEEEVTGSLIEKFVRDFNSGSLKLDETLYTFHHDDEDEEE